MQKIQMRIDSRLEDIALIGVASRALALHAGLDDRQAFEVELCVVAAVTHSVEHGYRCEPGHVVEVEVRITPSHLEFEVRDEGRGLDEAAPELEPEPPGAEPEVPSELADRGRGAFLIDQLMDRVAYKPERRGLTLTMSKTLNA